jgi:hypothetical protein
VAVGAGVGAEVGARDGVKVGAGVGVAVGAGVGAEVGADVAFQAHTGRTPSAPAPNRLGLKLKPSAEPM